MVSHRSRPAAAPTAKLPWERRPAVTNVKPPQRVRRCTGER